MFFNSIQTFPQKSQQVNSLQPVRIAICDYAKLTRNDFRCPTKWRDSLLRRTLQVHITSDTLKIQYSEWPT